MENVIDVDFEKKKDMEVQFVNLSNDNKLVPVEDNFGVEELILSSDVEQYLWISEDGNSDKLRELESKILKSFSSEKNGKDVGWFLEQFFTNIFPEEVEMQEKLGDYLEELLV